MPNQKRIDSIIDISSIEKEIEFLKKNLGSITETIKTFPVIKTKVEGATSVKELSKAQVELAESHKAVEKLVRDRFASESKLITLQTDYARETAKNRVEILRTNQELKVQAQLQEANTGSIEKARAAVKALTQERDKLNLFTAEGQKRQAELNEQINKYNNFIKKSVDDLAKQKINVGNYSGAVNILKGTLEEVSRKIDQNTKAGKGNADATQRLIKEQKILTQLVNSQAAGFAKGTMEVKANEKALLDLERAGLKGSKTYNDLAIATGKLKDSLADVRTRTKALGSDTFVFDGMIQGAQTLAGAYGVAQGAAALFGDENKELQKTFVKLQAIMTVIQGLQSIANGLQKENAAILLLQQAREKAVVGWQIIKNFVLKGSLSTIAANTVATNADTVAKGSNVVATRAATAATIGFRAALIATGIGAILVLLASAASAMSTFANDTGDATQSLEEFNDQLDISKSLLDSQINSIDFATKINAERIKQQTTSENALTKNEIDGLEKRKAALKSYYDEKKRSLSLVVNTDDDKEKRDALRKEIIDTGDQIVEIEREIALKIEQQKTSSVEKGRNERKKVLDKEKKDREEAAKKALEIAERNRKAEFQILKDDAEERAAIFKRTADDETINVLDRRDALVDWYNEKQSLLIAQKNFETENSKLTSTEILAIENKFRIDSNTLLQQYEDENLAIIKNATEKQKEEYEKRRKARIEGLEKEFEAVGGRQKDAENEAIKLLNDQFKEGLISAEEYARKREEIEQVYRIMSIHNEIQKQKELLKIANLPAADRAAAMRALSDLERELSDASVEFVKSNEQKKRDEISKTLDIIQSRSEEVFGFINGLLENNATRQKNNLQDELDGIEERVAAEIEAVNASTLTAQEKAAKIQIIQARAAAEKERIAKRERQIELDQARFAKAQAIFNIILATAQNIAKALTPQGKIIAAVSGAAQLAVAVSAPLPRFKLGKDKSNKYEGLAIVGDGGKVEPILRQGGKLELSPSTSTLTYLGRNDQVFPDINALMTAMANNSVKVTEMPKQKSNELDKIKQSFDSSAKIIVKAIENKREYHTSAKDGALVGIWKHGANQTRYIQENTNWS